MGVRLVEPAGGNTIRIKHYAYTPEVEIAQRAEAYCEKLGKKARYSHIDPLWAHTYYTCE